MQEKKVLQIYADHELSGVSYRNLGRKYGIGATTAYYIVKKKKEQLSVEQQSGPPLVAEGEDIALLKEALRKERLKNELLNTMIDIASKELGVDIRKKSGTR